MGITLSTFDGWGWRDTFVILQKIFKISKEIWVHTNGGGKGG